MNFRLLSATFSLALFCFYSKGQKKVLSIGDKIPDVKFVETVNYSHPKSSLYQFKGKILILDFWATWCGACIQEFPTIDSLQRKFKDDLQVLSVTYEDKQTALRVLNGIEKSRGIRISSVVSDTVLTKLFDFKFLPHYVWINREGAVFAITGADQLLEKNVESIINGISPNMPIKKDTLIVWNSAKPFLATYQLGRKEYDVRTSEYTSVFTSYIQETIAQSTMRRGFISCTNHSIRGLFQLAFGGFNIALMNKNRLVLEGFSQKDSLMVGVYSAGLKQAYKDNVNDNSYCYELIVKDTVFDNRKKCEIMQQDLNNYFGRKFGIRGRIENREANVLSLVRTSNENKLLTKNSQSNVKPKKELHGASYSMQYVNTPFKVFWSELVMSCQKWDRIIMDNTGIVGSIDLSIDADFSDVNSVNKELEKYDLKLIETQKQLPMVVISKK